MLTKKYKNEGYSELFRTAFMEIKITWFLKNVPQDTEVGTGGCICL